MPRIELCEGNRLKRGATATDGYSTGKGSSARPADPRGRNDRHQRDDGAPARGDGRPGHGLAGRRAVRGGQPEPRLPQAQAGRHGRRDHAAHTQAARGARTSRTGPSGPTRGSTAPWSASSGRPACAGSRPGGQGRPPTRSGSRRRSPRASRARRRTSTGRSPPQARGASGAWRSRTRGRAPPTPTVATRATCGPGAWRRRSRAVRTGRGASSGSGRPPRPGRAAHGPPRRACRSSRGASRPSWEASGRPRAPPACRHAPASVPARIRAAALARAVGRLWEVGRPLGHLPVVTSLGRASPRLVVLGRRRTYRCGSRVAVDPEVCTIDRHGDPPVGRGASAPFCRNGTIPAHGRSPWGPDPEISSTPSVRVISSSLRVLMNHFQHPIT